METKTELKEVNLGLLADGKKQNVQMKEKKKKASDCQESGCSLVIALIEVILKH